MYVCMYVCILLQFKTRIAHEYVKLKSYYTTNHLRFIFVLVLRALPILLILVTAKTLTAFLTVAYGLSINMRWLLVMI